MLQMRSSERKFNQSWSELFSLSSSCKLRKASHSEPLNVIRFHSCFCSLGMYSINFSRGREGGDGDRERERARVEIEIVEDDANEIDVRLTFVCLFVLLLESSHPHHHYYNSDVPFSPCYTFILPFRPSCTFYLSYPFELLFNSDNYT